MPGLALDLLLGFGIGLSLGLLGGGGSILTVPALVYLVGQTPQAAVTTSLAIVGMNSAVGAAFHNRQGGLNWSIAAIFGGAGMIVAYFAAGLSKLFSPALLMVAFALLMLAVGGLMLFQTERPQISQDQKPKWWVALLSGTVVGLLTGVLGVGGGFLIVPALPPEVPLVLVVKDEETYRKVVLSLARVGYENVIGYLSEGIEGWAAMGLPVMSGDIEDVAPSELNAMLNNGQHPLVVDVREPWEYNQGYIPGAKLIPLGMLANKVGELDAAQPVAVVCASGSRSQSAAALLGQKGFAKVYNLVNGMSGWQRDGFEITRN